METNRDGRSLSHLVEVAGNMGAIFLGFAYGSDFLIVALHHAQFGIADFGFLRSRVLFAGLLFAFLLLIPAMSAARVFAIFGLTSAVGTKISCEPQNRKYLYLFLGFSFYHFCYGLLGGYSAFLFGGYTPMRDPGFAIYLAIVLFLVVLTLYAASSFNKHPKWLTAAAFFCFVVGAWTTFAYSDRNQAFIAACYYVVGIGSVFIYFGIMSGERRKAINWEVILLWLIGILTLYSAKIYGNVKPHFGGGAPIPVVTHFGGQKRDITV